MLHLVPTSKATMTLINNKILDWSKFKVFADDKINVGLKLKTIYGQKTAGLPLSIASGAKCENF